MEILVLKCGLYVLWRDGNLGHVTDGEVITNLKNICCLSTDKQELIEYAEKYGIIVKDLED